MNVKNLLCLVSALSLATVSVTQAQTLTELAKQEKQRRAKLRTSGAPPKVFTEGDRSTAPEDTAATDSGATTTADPAAPTVSGAKKEKSREELAADQQKAWAEKVAKAQEEIKSLEDAIARNERSLASMYNITPARQDMINAIEADKKKVAELRQTLVNLEEERRRAGMPRR